MKAFMDKDFLLDSPTARTLYHDFAEGMPIADYHCHISPKEIFEDKRFSSITEVWLGGDHYKWRLMRQNGVPERFITGDATDREKFQSFAATLTRCIGNPMYSWCHLELKSFFGFEGVLSQGNADEVFDLCNKKLQSPEMSARGLILQSNVRMIGTTDDPTDSLEWHERIKNDPSFDVLVVPSYRPDKAINLHKAGFSDYVKKLEKVVGFGISSLADMKRALTATLERFKAHGCRASDHGLDYIPFCTISEAEADAALNKAINGEALTLREIEGYQTAILVHLGREYNRLSIVMQLHYGAVRSVNSIMLERLGPDTGYDCIDNSSCVQSIAKLFDALESTHELPKTILYSLDPKDNAQLCTVAGCFGQDNVRGKMQHGSAWWFNDTRDGMTAQLRTLASLGVLGNFVGMLTDSRSFLSYARHEYFRRILCNVMGGFVENGEYPNDIETVGGLVKDVCCFNAERCFEL